MDSLSNANASASMESIMHQHQNNNNTLPTTLPPPQTSSTPFNYNHNKSNSNNNMTGNSPLSHSNSHSHHSNSNSHHSHQPPPSTQYNELLTTITSLQSDLQRTLLFANTLKTENTTLKQNYEDMKYALVQTRKRYNSTRSALLVSMEDTKARESKTEVMVTKWRAALDSRTKELEVLQEKLAPMDLDLLRVKIEDEVSSVFKSRINVVEGEIDKWRQMFFKVRREYELCRTEYEQYTINASSDLEASHNNRKTEVSALQKALVKAVKAENDENSNREDKEESGRLRRKVMEMEVTESELRLEIDEVRGEKEKSELKAQEERYTHTSELADVLSKSALTENDKDAINRKVASCEVEITRLKSTNRESTSTAETARNEATRCRKIATDREREVADVKAESRDERDKMRRGFDVERDELHLTLDSIRKGKALAETSASSLTQQISDGKRSALQNEEKVRRESRENTALLQERIEELEDDILTFNDTGKREMVEHASELQRLTLESGTARSDASRISREKEALAARAAMLSDKNDVLKKVLDDGERNKENEGKKEKEWRVRGKELEREVDDMKVDNGELRRREEVMENDVVVLSKANDRLREENILAVNELKKSIEKDREAMRGKMKEEVAKLKAKLVKEQKKSAGYKEKAIEAHQRNVRVRSQLNAASGGGGEISAAVPSSSGGL